MAIKFQVWNRQTHPIILRKSLVIVAPEAAFEADDPVDAVFQGTLPDFHDEIIAPGGRGCFERKGTMKILPLGSACDVHVDYFDPITNRFEKINARREPQTLEIAARETVFSFQRPSQRAWLAGVYSSLQSACPQVRGGVRSLLSRLRIVRLRLAATLPRLSSSKS